MKKKLAILFLTYLIFSNIIFANEIYVKITPQEEIRTSSKQAQEGDYFKFKVVDDVIYNGKTYFKKDDVIVGLLIERTENGSFGKPATLYFNQFKKDGNLLNGAIHETGNNRDNAYEFFAFLAYTPFCEWFRGSEIRMRPDKSFYTLGYEVK